jgi:hypothetical protein
MFTMEQHWFNFCVNLKAIIQSPYEIEGLSKF